MKQHQAQSILIFYVLCLSVLPLYSDFTEIKLIGILRYTTPLLPLLPSTVISQPALIIRVATFTSTTMSPKWPSEAVLFDEPDGAEELENLCQTIDIAGEAGLQTITAVHHAKRSG